MCSQKTEGGIVAKKPGSGFSGSIAFRQKDEEGIPTAKNAKR